MKRFLDIIFSMIFLVLLSPVFAVVALSILISDGRPILFNQKRIGYQGKEISVYKFRTLKKGTREVSTASLYELEKQLIPCGKFLRKTSIDELPQMLNVLLGSMSFVGPRPLIPCEKEIHIMRKTYHVYDVKPGITGLAQVNGRDNISIEQKALYDKEYVEKHNIAMDFKILVKTVLNVITEKDVCDPCPQEDINIGEKDV